jgi:hypothetical protein
MTKPTYLVKIAGKDVDCLGEQLVAILETIQPYLNGVIWYASDVLATTKPPFILDYKKFTPKRVGATTDMITVSHQVDQFLSGVFFALPNDEGDQLNEEYGTEDEEFRDMRDAVLEIRAFDTSYFEIYANDFDLIHKISRGFYGIVVRNLEKIKMLQEELKGIRRELSTFSNPVPLTEGVTPPGISPNDAQKMRRLMARDEEIRKVIGDISY